MTHYLDLVRTWGPALRLPSRFPWLARLLFGTEEAQEVDVMTRALLQVRQRDGCLVRLSPNAAQQAYARRCSRRNIILKARQVGMTTYVAARFFLLTAFREGTVTLQVAHTQESAEQIFRIVRRFYDTLHADLGKQIVTDRATLRELAFANIDSRYLVDTAGNRNVGRGLTIHNLHASEVALWPGEPKETMAGLLAAVVPDGLVDVESTPHGVGGYFHSEWLRAQRGEPGAMTPHFFPWWVEPAYGLDLCEESVEPYSPEEQRLVERAGLGPGQMRFRRWIRATFGERAPQEYAETDVDCFLLSGRPVFETALIESRFHELPPPIATHHNGALMVWHEPQANRSYIIGADVAEGKASGDYSAAVVIDAVSGLQCAELMARWPVGRFAEELDRLGQHYNKALLAVERNNHGHAVLHTLRQQLGYPRLYRHLDTHGHGAAADGWPMNAQTKPQAVQALANMLCDAPRVFLSPRLLEQCRRFAWTDNGGMAARGGSGSGGSADDTSAHDDLVIAMAIAQAVRAQAPPLSLLSSAV